MTVRAAILGGVLILAAGSGGGYWLGRVTGEGREPGDDSPVVAQFRGGQITRQQLQQRIDAQGPIVKQQLATPEAMRKFLDDLIRERLLVAAAENRGLDRTAEVQIAYARELIQRLERAEVEEPLKAHPPTDEELKQFFEVHKAEYQRPDSARAAHIFLVAPPGADRKKREADARDLLATARARLAKDYGGFAQLAREKSEDPRTRALGGEIPFTRREDLEKHFGKPLADAVFAAKGPGLLDQGIESDAGFHVVQVLERDAAVEPAFETMKEALRSRFEIQRRQEARNTLSRRLVDAAEVKVDEAALSGITTSASATR